jgi:hypothetical protein
MVVNSCLWKNLFLSLPKIKKANLKASLNIIIND